MVSRGVVSRLGRKAAGFDRNVSGFLCWAVQVSTFRPTGNSISGSLWDAVRSREIEGRWLGKMGLLAKHSG